MDGIDKVGMLTMRFGFLRQVDANKPSPKDELAHVLTDERSQRRPKADIFQEIISEPNSMATHE